MCKVCITSKSTYIANRIRIFYFFPLIIIFFWRRPNLSVTIYFAKAPSKIRAKY